MRRVTTNLLRLAAVPVGVVIGVWTSLMTVVPTCQCGGPACFCGDIYPQPRFTAWECVLFGLGATVVLVLAAEAVARLRSPS